MRKDSPQQCQVMCDATFRCSAFEYAAGGTPGAPLPGFCRLRETHTPHKFRRGSFYGERCIAKTTTSSTTTTSTTTTTRASFTKDYYTPANVQWTEAGERARPPILECPKNDVPKTLDICTRGCKALIRTPAGFPHGKMEMKQVTGWRYPKGCSIKVKVGPHCYWNRDGGGTANMGGNQYVAVCLASNSDEVRDCEVEGWGGGLGDKRYKMGTSLGFGVFDYDANSKIMSNWGAFNGLSNIKFTGIGKNGKGCRFEGFSDKKAQGKTLCTFGVGTYTCCSVGGCGNDKVKSWKISSQDSPPTPKYKPKILEIGEGNCDSSMTITTQCKITTNRVGLGLGRGSFANADGCKKVAQDHYGYGFAFIANLWGYRYCTIFFPCGVGCNTEETSGNIPGYYQAWYGKPTKIMEYRADGTSGRECFYDTGEGANVIAAACKIGYKAPKPGDQCVVEGCAEGWCSSRYKKGKSVGLGTFTWSAHSPIMSSGGIYDGLSDLKIRGKGCVFEGFRLSGGLGPRLCGPLGPGNYPCCSVGKCGNDAVGSWKVTLNQALLLVEKTAVGGEEQALLQEGENLSHYEVGTMGVYEDVAPKWSELVGGGLVGDKTGTPPDWTEEEETAYINAAVSYGWLREKTSFPAVSSSLLERRTGGFALLHNRDDPDECQRVSRTRFGFIGSHVYAVTK